MLILSHLDKTGKNNKTNAISVVNAKILLIRKRNDPNSIIKQTFLKKIFLLVIKSKTYTSS